MKKSIVRDKICEPSLAVKVKLLHPIISEASFSVYVFYKVFVPYNPIFGSGFSHFFFKEVQQALKFRKKQVDQD
jgi:hypothetical protein